MIILFRMNADDLDELLRVVYDQCISAVDDNLSWHLHFESDGLVMEWADGGTGDDELREIIDGEVGTAINDADADATPWLLQMYLDDMLVHGWGASVDAGDIAA